MKDSALTKRQEGILKLLCQGMSRNEVAALLGIQRQTLKVHLMNIRRRTGATNTVEAAYQQGLREARLAQPMPWPKEHSSVSAADVFARRSA